MQPNEIPYTKALNRLVSETKFWQVQKPVNKLTDGGCLQSASTVKILQISMLLHRRHKTTQYFVFFAFCKSTLKAQLVLFGRSLP